MIIGKSGFTTPPTSLVSQLVSPYTGSNWRLLGANCMSRPLELYKRWFQAHLPDLGTFGWFRFVQVLLLVSNHIHKCKAAAHGMLVLSTKKIENFKGDMTFLHTQWVGCEANCTCTKTKKTYNGVFYQNFKWKYVWWNGDGVHPQFEGVLSKWIFDFVST